MNQELGLSFSFIEANCKTLSDLKKRIDEINQFTGNSKSVARTGNINTSTEFVSPNSSLMPQTFNFTKINNARINLETEQAFKDLGIERL